MPRYVAFLRAINVGGRIVKMERLKKRFETLGFDDVETFIASGNVVFRSRSKDARALERRIERALQDELGYEVATFVRTDQAVKEISKCLPFPVAAHKAAGAFVVGFLMDAPDKQAVSKLKQLESPIDRFAVRGTEFYWLCRHRQSESTFSNALFERTLGAPSTFRGMNTIVRLAARYPWKT